MVVVAYGFVAFAFIRLRQKEPDLERPFKVRHGMLVGYLALVMSFLLGLLYLPFSPSALLWPQEWIVVLAGALIGLVFYLTARSKRSASAESRS